jgi:hypothetical protein
VNPYWTEIEPSVKDSEFYWEGKQVGRFKFDWHEGDPPILDRNEFVGRYAWSIPDPQSVSFVQQHAHNGLVDPMAGTGYWGYVLAQVGVDVVCYDLEPPPCNTWHKDAWPWVDVEQLDATLAVVKHPDRTLFMSWPPYGMDIGVDTVNAYQGNRIIYIGEGPGGCTGNDALHQVLEEEWREVDERVPIQWYGLHDRITVYERRPRAELPRIVTEVRDVGTLRTCPERASDVPERDNDQGAVVPVLQRS